VIEVVGDSSRDGDVALVRLAVEGDRIVDQVPTYRGEGKAFL